MSPIWLTDDMPSKEEDLPIFKEEADKLAVNSSSVRKKVSFPSLYDIVCEAIPAAKSPTESNAECAVFLRTIPAVIREVTEDPRRRLMAPVM